MTDDDIKVTTAFLYTRIPEAVERYPASSPLAIARGLIARLTDDQRRAVLEQLVSHRIATAQQVRDHARHQVSVHD